MVIRVLDIVEACNTSGEGMLVADAVRAELAKHKRVRLSFDGVADVPSSFINASIVVLFKEMNDIGELDRLLITGVNSQIAGMIRRCVQNSRRHGEIS